MRDVRQLWQAVLNELQLCMTRANFDTYFADTWALSLEGQTLVVGVKNPFLQETLEQRFMGQIRKTLGDVADQALDVRLVAQSGPRPGNGVPPVEAPEPFWSPAPDLNGAGQSNGRGTGDRSSNGRRGASNGQSAPRPMRAPLNPRYTFASFVVGNSNKFAHAAAEAVAQSPGQAYNPLFLYGGVGLGKTHLLHAIGHGVMAQGLPVVYGSSETFTNELIESIREHRMEEFRGKYRRAGLLMVDDIQFIAGKERTEEEFFHTFNAIHEGGGQVVLTSDRAPQAMTVLSDRLRSRFEWGLIADVQPPDLETRIAILSSKTRSGSVPVPPEVLEFIANKVQSNIRELEGTLNRVLAYATLHRQPIDIELAATALHEVLTADPRPSLGPDAILPAVARYFGVSLDDLKGKVRERKIVVPRQVAMYLLREDARLSLPEIGQVLGGRDHSTVLHGVRTIQADLDADSRLRGDVKGVRDLLKAK